MAKSMKCRDVGLDCDYVARGETEDEVMAQVSDHAREAHGISDVSPALAQQVKAAIKEE